MTICRVDDDTDNAECRPRSTPIHNIVGSQDSTRYRYIAQSYLEGLQAQLDVLEPLAAALQAEAAGTADDGQDEQGEHTFCHADFSSGTSRIRYYGNDNTGTNDECLPVWSHHVQGASKVSSDKYFRPLDTHRN